MGIDGNWESTYFKLGEFEGPLDLLLFLIKKNEVNIYDIPIAQITEQYLQYLNYATKIDLDNLTEFYVLASTLLYIKSRMLLPVEFDIGEEFEDPRKELVGRLIEYQKYKKLSQLISDKEKEAEWIIERRANQFALPFDDDSYWEEVAVWDLLKVFSNIISSVSVERVIDLYEEVTVNEKITLVNELLETKKDFLFTDLIKNKQNILEIVCAFLAILEMVKQKLIGVYQNRLFGDIGIKRTSLGTKYGE
jgi:segregation and condensation protein A